MKSASFNQNMDLIVIHQYKNFTINNNNSDDLLRFAVCSEPLASITLSCLNGNSHSRGNNRTIAIPQDWVGQSIKDKSGIRYYKNKIPVFLGATNQLKVKPWFIISNGRFVTRINNQLLCKMLDRFQADVVAVNVSPQLQAGCEKALVNSQGELIGFRRFYDDSTQSAPVPDDWPHHLFIKIDTLKRLLDDNSLSSSFTDFLKICFSNSLTVHSLSVAGAVLDLGTEQGLLGFIAAGLDSKYANHYNSNNRYRKEVLNENGIEISTGAKLFGKVLFGRDVSIGPNAIIVGPSVIGSGASIAKGAVVRESIVGPSVSVSAGSILQNRVLINGKKLSKQAGTVKINCTKAITSDAVAYKDSCMDGFRIWPGYSYPGGVKRIADIITALAVLVLFAPIFPLIAVVIKLVSRGPVFFKDTRQGLHGKPFSCLKFRTMLVGADNLQDKLRGLNIVDGPQFKMADDPRLSTVGGFLRDTYIDEIPQFFNVLLGQMSVVGPRPSPESENTLCPSWRDARLSVRPGITGLWQVCRTRLPMRDFQEWIHFDTEYVRGLSLRMDLWICWQTTKKMIKNFVGQF